MTLSDFMAQPHLRNLWIHEPDLHLHCYMRRSKRCLQSKELTLCLDISSVEVEEEHWGQGHFSTFLGRVEAAALADNRAVLVENIQHPWLVEALLRRGYSPTSTSVPMCPTLWRNP